MQGILDTPIRTTGGHLTRVLATRFPVVVVFEKPDCEPCARLEPALEGLARDFIDRVRVVRVEDTDALTATRFRIRSVPTLVFWRHGHEVNRIEGQAATDAIRSHVSYLLSEGPRPAPVVGPGVDLTRPPAPAPPAACEEGPLSVTDESFEELVLRSPLPVLVDFWAVWCAPCRMMSAVVDELAREHAGRLRVVKMNIDQSPGWPARLRIMGIPAFVLFRAGREAGRIVGAVRKAVLEDAVSSLLEAR